MTSKEGIVVGCVDESGLDQVDEVRMRGMNTFRGIFQKQAVGTYVEDKEEERSG